MMITNQHLPVARKETDGPRPSPGFKTFSRARLGRQKFTAPALRFSPTAWAKLLFLRDLGETEVGGFGIATADDLLYLEDIQLVRQVCSGVSVAFDDLSVADFFDRQVDQGRKPELFARAWVHSHPGDSAEPSFTDEETFARVFRRTDWAVMFILARGGQSYARLRFNVGPGGEMEIPVTVDYSRPFPASEHEAWWEEYLANVRPEVLDPGQVENMPHLSPAGLFEPFGADDDWLQGWPDLFEEPADFQESAHGNFV